MVIHEGYNTYVKIAIVVVRDLGRIWQILPVSGEDGDKDVNPGEQIADPEDSGK